MRKASVKVARGSRETWSPLSRFSPHRRRQALWRQLSLRFPHQHSKRLLRVQVKSCFSSERRCKNGFPVIVACHDRGIEFEQNLAGRTIAIVLIHARSSRLADLLDAFVSR